MSLLWLLLPGLSRTSGFLLCVILWMQLDRISFFVFPKYLGAAHLISDPRVLEAAGSILPIEARHQTILNVMSGTGTAIPQAFDIAMSPSEVLAIAGGFISGCDTGIPRKCTVRCMTKTPCILSAFPTANTALAITNQGTPSAGTLLTFSWAGMPSDISVCHLLKSP